VGRKRIISGELEAGVEQLFAKAGATDSSVARALGLDRCTVGRWRRRRERETDPELLRARREHAELVALRRRVKVLEEERKILAKAAAFLARETGRTP
jgi:transposase